MKKDHDDTMIDDESPEWTREDFKNAKRLKDVHPEIVTAFKNMRPRGRPPLAVTKEQITIRLSADVLEHFKNMGPGWQTRIDETLRGFIQ